MRRCACGYPFEFHDSDGHCPLCQCGKTVAEHGQVTSPPSPFRSFGATGPVIDPPSPLRVVAFIGVALRGTIRVQHVCPGKPRTAAGALPTLRRGQFRDPEPPETYRVRVDGSLVPWAPEVVAEVDMGPRVPARLAESADEVAPAAMRLGKRAAGAGWAVDAWWWVAHDGTETSALVLQREGGQRGFASWDRSPGGRWATAGALAWSHGDRPHKVGVKLLADLLGDVLASSS